MFRKIAEKIAVLVIEALVPKLVAKIEELIDKDLNNDGIIGDES